MHLWPSLKIRDSFNLSYLKKLDWNLTRMNSEKDSNQNQSLLSTEEAEDVRVPKTKVPTSVSNVLSAVWIVVKELALLLSCCYCCYCCGACTDEGDNM